MQRLAEAFGARTRVVVLNNPLNPSATLFAPEDLDLLARYCQRFDVTALCDEVWEHVVFDGARHRPLMALPGMRERTVKIGSAGKIFSLTGWKVGFVMADARLMRGLAKAQKSAGVRRPCLARIRHGLLLPLWPRYGDAVARIEERADSGDVGVGLHRHGSRPVWDPKTL